MPPPYTPLNDRYMLGAIIGDIVGSIYEPKDRRSKTKGFPFFSENCRFTDDSACTVAVADTLLHDLSPTETMRKWGVSILNTFEDYGITKRLLLF